MSTTHQSPLTLPADARVVLPVPARGIRKGSTVTVIGVRPDVNLPVHCGGWKVTVRSDDGAVATVQHRSDLRGGSVVAHAWRTAA